MPISRDDVAMPTMILGFDSWLGANKHPGNPTSRQTWGDYFPNVMIMITIILLCHDYDCNYDYTIKL